MSGGQPDEQAIELALRRLGASSGASTASAESEESKERDSPRRHRPPDAWARGSRRRVSPT